MDFYFEATQILLKHLREGEWGVWNVHLLTTRWGKRLKILLISEKCYLKFLIGQKKMVVILNFFFGGDVGIMTYATIINDEWSAVNQHLLIKGWFKIFKRVLTYNSWITSRKIWFWTQHIFLSFNSNNYLNYSRI